MRKFCIHKLHKSWYDIHPTSLIKIMLSQVALCLHPTAKDPPTPSIHGDYFSAIMTTWICLKLYACVVITDKITSSEVTKLAMDYKKSSFSKSCTTISMMTQWNPPVATPHKCVVMQSFNFLLAWTSSWTNSQFVGDVRCHNSHVMSL